MTMKMNASRFMRGDDLGTRIERFSQDLVQLHDKRQLFQRPVPDIAQDAELLRQALEHLQRQHESLCVADEELRVQVGQLSDASARLAAERQRYQELFDFAPDPFFCTDRCATIRDANVAATEMVGVELRFLRGKPLASFVAHHDVSRFRALTNQLGVEGPTELQLNMQSRSGATESVLLKGRVLDNRHHILWIARRVDARHAELERLTTLDAERKALAQAGRVQALLDLWRMASNRLSLNLQSIDCSTLTAFIVNALMPEAESRRVKLTSDLEARVLVMGDPTRLAQVLMNLLSNALKRTKPGGQIHVRTSAASGSAVLSVADSGDALSKQELLHVFDRFEQAGGETAEPNETDLDLHLVRELVRLHGGSASVTSQARDKGVTFSVKLPLFGASARQDASTQPADQQAS
jgi:PAS domain S-box-containing protein